MTTNNRECKIIPIKIASYKVDVDLKLPLCSTDCDSTDEAKTNYSVQMFDQASSSVQVSVVGYNKVHIIASDGRANCIGISVTRIIKCQNCIEGCAPIVVEEDMGCIRTGHILATGDYVFYVKPQINYSATELDDIELTIVLEPLIDEHINVAMINNMK